MNTISRLSRNLHWIIAIVMICMWISHIPMENLEDTPAGLSLTLNHASVGMAVFIFGIIRFLNRMREGFPTPLGNQPAMLKMVASIVHWVLLILPIAMPITGFMMFYSSGYPISWFGIQITAGTGVQNKSMGELGQELHGIGGTILLIVVILHVAGALKHHFIDKDDTLKRMLGR